MDMQTEDQSLNASKCEFAQNYYSQDLYESVCVWCVCEENPSLHVRRN